MTKYTLEHPVVFHIKALGNAIHSGNYSELPSHARAIVALEPTAEHIRRLSDYHVPELERRWSTLMAATPKELSRMNIDRVKATGAIDSALSLFKKHLGLGAVDRFKTKEKPFRYSAVEDVERHPDYQATGIAPIIGRHLNEIAQEDSDRGRLAEGILRTGDHNLLPILNDALAGDEYTNPHPLHAEYDAQGKRTSGPIDWHHAPRAIAVDREINHVLRGQTAPFAGSHITLAPINPHQLLNDWIIGIQRPGQSRRALLQATRTRVPDANNSDVLHALMRLHINDEMRHGIDYPLPHYNGILGLFHHGKSNAHEYVDTRPVEKRQQLLYAMKNKKSKSWISHKIALLMEEGYPQKQAIAIAFSMAGRAKKTKYAITKAGSKGMVDQVSPLSAFGTWRKPGQFSTSLQFQSGRDKPQLKTTPFTAGRLKPQEPAPRTEPEKKRHKLSVEYVRKLVKHLGKIKRKRTDM